MEHAAFHLSTWHAMLVHPGEDPEAPPKLANSKDMTQNPPWMWASSNLSDILSKSVFSAGGFGIAGASGSAGSAAPTQGQAHRRC